MLLGGCLVVVEFDIKIIYFQISCGRQRKWLLHSMVIKINREYLCIILMTSRRTNVNKKYACLTCNACVVVSKRCNVNQHFMTIHKDYISTCTDNNGIFRNKVEDMKRHVRSRQAIFSKPKPTNKATRTIIASYISTDILVKKKKKKKHLKYGNVIKESLVVARDLLFNYFKNTMQLKRSSYLKVLY
jgi:hypothetical protein